MHGAVQNNAGLGDDSWAVHVTDDKRRFQGDYFLDGVDRPAERAADHHGSRVYRTVRTTAASDDDTTVGFDPSGKITVDSEQSRNADVSAEERSTSDNRVNQ